MSGISSSVGLISGLPTADLIDQLIAAESLPLIRLQVRVAGLEAKRSTLNDLLSKLLSIQTAVEDFDDESLFNRFNASSSDESILSATAGAGAAPGTFSFRVHSLVTNHQLISAGLADSDTTPVGSGTLSLEIGHGKLGPDTPLDALNGGTGVRGGIIEITDRSGESAEIDLSAALTVTDVLDAINNASDIDVLARVSGDTLVIEDQTGQITEDLAIQDVGDGFAAADLGLAQSSASGTITGPDLINLSDSTSLLSLNDGNGIRTNSVGNDLRIAINGTTTFDISLNGNLDVNGKNALAVLNSGKGVNLGVIRITDRSGASADVDLSDAQTVQDVLDAINTSGLDVSAVVDGAGQALQITDTTGGEGTLTLEDVTGTAAADLGIAGEYSLSSFVGQEIYRIATVGDAMRAINYGWDQNGASNAGGAVFEARISSDGNRLEIFSPFPPGTSIEVTALEGSNAATDLGLDGSLVLGEQEALKGRRILAGLNTVLLKSLNGGTGVDLGTVSFSNRNGDPPTTIDFASLGVETVQELLEAVNATSATSGIQAALNSAGNGIRIEDTTGGTGSLVISDQNGGAMAQQLGLAGELEADVMDSGNLQLQYVSEATLLDSLNHGEGVRTGSFQITTADGSVYTVNITNSQKNVRDVLSLIEAITEDKISATINATGDGILLTDTSEGEGPLIVGEEDGGFSATDLGIEGQSDTDTNTIDGSFEIKVDIDSDDTLDDVVAKLNEAGADVTASIINDGSAFNPYHLSVSSSVSGTAGEIVFDPGTSGLSMSTLVQPRDAVVFLGEGSGATSILVQSSTNTINGVLPDVTLNLEGVSDEPVTLSITQDVDSLVDDVSAFVAEYNGTLDFIDEVTFFDSESLDRGILFGDSTVNRVRSRLHDMVAGEFEGAPELTSRLSEIGINFVTDARLEFDESKFSEVYAESDESVEVLFTLADSGVGDAVEDALAAMTDSIDGLVPSQDALMGDQIELLNEEIDITEERLDAKRAQLEREFVALETALAALQGQESALALLSSLVGTI